MVQIAPRHAVVTKGAATRCEAGGERVQRIRFSILALLFSSALLGSEHAQCADSVFYGETVPAAEFRELARSCKDPALAELLRHRAKHHQLLASARILARLDGSFQPFKSDDPEAARIYMAMVEALAPVWYPDKSRRIAFLIAEYRRQIQVAELRLKGFDQAAARLEREFADTD
jgi:hypothetical protein